MEVNLTGIRDPQRVDCFSFSSRDVELILVARGVSVSYKSIRDWGIRFGRQVAAALKRRRPKPGDKWHLDEMSIRIRGKLHYLWRAVDQDGAVLDILVEKRRDTDAAKTPLQGSELYMVGSFLARPETQPNGHLGWLGRISSIGCRP